MDRRKRKTREAIRQACLEIIQEKGFDAMTILDIAERADINRGTFYLHFVDKYDMIDKFEEEFISKIEIAIMTNIPEAPAVNQLIASRYMPLVQIFDCFKEDRDILDVLFKTKGILSFQNRLNQLFENIFNYERIPRGPQFRDNVPTEFFQTILVSIILGIAQYWMQGKEDYSSEELAMEMLNIIVNGPAKAAGLLPGELIDISEMVRNLKTE